MMKYYLALIGLYLLLMGALAIALFGTCIVTPPGAPPPAVTSNRTVIDTEQGSFFDPVTGLSNSEYGMFIMISSNATGSTLPAQGIKEIYSRIEGFSTDDDNGLWPYFPYAEFKAYEASEVAAGRAPLFMTATYQGQKRPLVIVYDLFLNSSQVPTTAPNIWHYAVNVGDPRFVKFWINHYLRPILWERANTTRNVWVGLDENPVKRSTFGVIDDSGKFVANVPWDQPFPQTDQAWTTAMKAFFDQAHAIAPDLRITPNVGGMDFPTQFQSIFGSQPGVVYENFWDGPAPVAFIRNVWAPVFQQVYNFGQLGKVTMLRENVNLGGTDLLSATALYELVKGPNFFYCPMNKSGSTGVDPANYQSWLDRLGNPSGAYTAAQESGKPSGYMFFSRSYDGGLVYLNWSGVTKTITLPGTHYNSGGSAITSLTLADGQGAIATTSASRAAKPQISPRYASTVKGPLTVTMEAPTSGSTIHYTTDGSTPTGSSPTYSSSFTVSSTSTVKAIAVKSGMANSAISSAAYTITNSTPVVSFNHSSDTGIAGDGFGTLQMSAMSTVNVVVSYSVLKPDSTTTTGSVTIYADDTYAHLPIPAGGTTGQHFVVTLTGATNATVGGGTYTYTIQ